jgi:RNAse (barnase) inhibitor barstar
MGKRNGPYEADFPVGTTVRIASRVALEAFLSEWNRHNPLEPEQLTFAGRVATVSAVGYYHGGDELYELGEVPGVWHEACLDAVEPVVIDLSEVRTASALHELLAHKLAFPDYYGRNWDAFNDCFCDADAGSWPDAVRFVGWEALAQRLPRDAKLFRECVESGLANGARCTVEWAG